MRPAVGIGVERINTGQVITKLDGTARSGVLVAAASEFKLPIHAVDVGETIDDLRPFDAAVMAKAIAGGRGVKDPPCLRSKWGGGPFA